MAPHTVGIIGASGLLGKFVAPAFLARKDYSVTLLTRKVGSWGTWQGGLRSCARAGMGLAAAERGWPIGSC